MKTYAFRVEGKQYQVEIEGPVAAEFTVVVNGKAYSVSRETLSAPAPAPVLDRTETAAPKAVRSAPASPALAQPVPAGRGASRVSGRTGAAGAQRILGRPHVDLHRLLRPTGCRTFHRLPPVARRQRGPP